MLQDAVTTIPNTTAGTLESHLFVEWLLFSVNIPQAPRPRRIAHSVLRNTLVLIVQLLVSPDLLRTVVAVAEVDAAAILLHGPNGDPAARPPDTRLRKPTDLLCRLTAFFFCRTHWRLGLQLYLRHAVTA